MRSILLCLIVMLLQGCASAPDSHTETEKIHEVLFGFYDGVSNLDMAKIKKYTAADFVMFENELVWTADDVLNKLRAIDDPEAVFEYDLVDFKTTLEGTAAWMTLRNNGRFVINGEESEGHWIESAIFRKESGQWKIVMLHSTRIPS